MAKEKILIVTPDQAIGSRLESELSGMGGYDVVYMTDTGPGSEWLKSSPVDLLLLSEGSTGSNWQDFCAAAAQSYPALPILLLARTVSAEGFIKALRLGVWDIVPQTASLDQLLLVIQACLERKGHLDNWVQVELRRTSKSLQRKLDSLELLQQIARSVTSSLDLDTILTLVVDAAVDITSAEEGSLLLLDESTGELYMRAGRNFQDDFVRKFRLPMRDSLAGQVLRTGAPISLNEQTPQKIKTSYLVYTLLYVPLKAQGKIIGVLGVDNRQSGKPFLEEHMEAITRLADFTAIAIDNAHFYQASEQERKKLETIVAGVEDGVIVVDPDRRVLLANPKARSAFNLGENPVGKPIGDVLMHGDLLELFENPKTTPSRVEISLEEGRVYNAQVSPIAEIGTVVTMQDITHLKDLDRIKSEFVSTVSHDLRSPLTAILGYVELIGRAGPVTEKQKEFIRRVQTSVHNITSLINDLLDLGRIEAGFDERNELVSMPAVIQAAKESLNNRISEKNQEFTLNVPGDLPTVLGNPARLRQMMTNLLNNACKFTPDRGVIEVWARARDGQLIIRISDNGPGIPPSDQAFVFDKFYRGSNISYDIPGSGLGLAIVKSIVEAHRGRIWLESSTDQGARFTIVLPYTDEGL